MGRTPPCPWRDRRHAAIGSSQSPPQYDYDFAMDGFIGSYFTVRVLASICAVLLAAGFVPACITRLDHAQCNVARTQLKQLAEANARESISAICITSTREDAACVWIGCVNYARAEKKRDLERPELSIHHDLPKVTKQRSRAHWSMDPC